MNVVVCYKITPDVEDMEVRPDRTLSFDRAEWNIGMYDLQAIEAGVRLAEATNGTVSALSAGTARVQESKARKAILSRGPQDLYLVADETLQDADAHLTAKALAEAIRKRGAYDVVVCGEGSSDFYAQQVGPQLGQLLDVPVVNAVNKIEARDGKLIVERLLADEVQVLDVPLPAVLCVTTEINTTRIPGMKEILGAGKKPSTVWSLAELGLSGQKYTRVVSTLAPKLADRKQVILEGESDNIIQQVIGQLKSEGAL